MVSRIRLNTRQDETRQDTVKHKEPIHKPQDRTHKTGWQAEGFAGEVFIFFKNFFIADQQETGNTIEEVR